MVRSSKGSISTSRWQPSANVRSRRLLVMDQQRMTPLLRGREFDGPVEAGVTDLLSRCQWDAGTLGLGFPSPFLPSGNHFGTSAGSTISCWSTFQAPSSFTRV